MSERIVTSQDASASRKSSSYNNSMRKMRMSKDPNRKLKCTVVLDGGYNDFGELVWDIVDLDGEFIAGGFKIYEEALELAEKVVRGWKQVGFKSKWISGSGGIVQPISGKPGVVSLKRKVHKRVTVSADG